MSGPALPQARGRRPAPQPSLRELALAEIRLAITAGQLDEGRTYSAAGLAKELEMSLSPVREAMMSLVSEGTVEAVPNRGFRLRHVSLADLEEIIRIRVVLAMPAVEDLCRRAREARSVGGGDAEIDGELDRLDELAQAGVAAIKAGRLADFLRLDREFHHTLLEDGLGHRAADISVRLRDQSRVVGLDHPVLVGDRETAGELVEIVGLLRAGRLAEAQEAVTRNLHAYRRALDGGRPA